MYFLHFLKFLAFCFTLKWINFFWMHFNAIKCWMLLLLTKRREGKMNLVDKMNEQRSKSLWWSRNCELRKGKVVRLLFLKRVFFYSHWLGLFLYLYNWIINFFVAFQLLYRSHPGNLFSCKFFQIFFGEL